MATVSPCPTTSMRMAGNQPCYIIFFKGPGDWTDRLIRFRTRSPYSHCEIRVGSTRCFTSHESHGGVVEITRTDFTQWDVFLLPQMSGQQVLDFFKATSGDKYNWLGILGCAIGVGMHTTHRWHCSHWCATLLGMHKPTLHSPGSVHRALFLSDGPAPQPATLQEVAQR